MQLRTQSKTRSTPVLSVAQLPGDLLQRKCGCGEHAAGACQACSKENERLLQHSPRRFAPTKVLPIGQGVLRSSGQALDEATGSFMESRFGYDFSKVRARVGTTAEGATPRFEGERFVPSLSGNGVTGITETLNKSRETEKDPIHGRLIDEFRERELLPPGGRDPTGAPVGPSDAQIKYGGLLLPCPQSTEVANVIDMRNEGLSAGFGTAYGIHAQMRVRPDARTWDGTRIVESLTAGTNSCPDTLTRGEPCSGGSTFIVGSASGGSVVLPRPRPGAINRFWDFHVTHVRPRNVSVLHDPARNPANLNTCSTACNQEYRCDGNVIGRHTITRTYTKGIYNQRNVTFVDVTKT